MRLVMTVGRFQSLYFSALTYCASLIYGQARTAAKSFASPEGDHITLINVYRAATDLLEKRTIETNKTKNEKDFRKWCKENFINSRSLRHARDIHRLFYCA